MNSENNTNPDTALPLHPLEFQILLALIKGSAHAYAIVCAIEEQQPEGKPILPTNMYRRIWRLVSAGLVDEVPGDDSDTARPRKHLAITPLGRRVAVAEATRLRQLLGQARAVGVRPDTGSGR